MTGIEKVISIYGSQVAASKELGISSSLLNHWVRGRFAIPANRCVEIEKKTGVSRAELRPDLFA